MRDRILGSPWSSGIGVIISIFLGFVLFSPQYFPPVVVDFARYIATVAPAGLGLWAKDGKSNGSKPGPPAS